MSLTIPTLTLPDRLKLALRQAGCTRAGMASGMGVSESTINNWLCGRTSPGHADVLLWAQLCAVDHVWLEHGSVQGE